MTVNESFIALQEHVDGDVALAQLARERRDIFKDALRSSDDVESVWGSGSLRRSTQLQPIHDVDLVVEFDRTAHPDWGNAGASASEALERCRDLVTERLGIDSGTHERLVRLVRTANRNRAAKCFVDPPEDELAFTVDVMPAIRVEGGILIPLKSEERWTLADPEYLAHAVSDRQAAWDKFRPLVRVLKFWSKQQSVEIKSLVMEVLALDCLVEAANRPAAVASFFARAAQHSLDVTDPAGLSGPIQPNLDVAGFRDALEEASIWAAAAQRAVADNNQPEATRLWAHIFGSAFPIVLPPTGETPGPRPVKDSPQGRA
ncbi:hypothetical protein [Demequina sp.]|uniref:hypothetical protein n=1 Tax=Demequina sp. TaxID=2050685 RepID=UPI003D0E1B19